MHAFAFVMMLLIGAGVAHAGSPQDAMLQTWSKTLEGDGSDTGSKDTPVTRVVRLLKEMSSQLQKEMNEDAELYDKLACWCNTNEYEKTNEISAAEAKISELESSIESNSARSEELKVTIKQLEDGVAADKQSLAEATELREKELKEFHGEEVDSIQAVENLKAAIVVLSKHHGGALPQLSFSLLSVHGTGSKGRTMPWDEDDHESRLSRSFDQFLSNNGFTSGNAAPSAGEAASPHKFLQQADTAEDEQHSNSDAAASVSAADSGPAWSAEDTAVIQRALHSASVFMQTHQGEDYYPSYAARSGEILGILQQLKEQMEGQLSETQKAEMARATAFADLRASKQSMIDSGERQAEQKEDELAKTDMDLAEAKEDIEQTKASLTEQQKFMMNLKETCQNADKNFEQRKNARLSEINAVSEAMKILMADDARDTFSATYKFLQVASRKGLDDNKQQRARAAELMKSVAAKLKSPELAILATRVQLDAFTRVKKAIDGMVAQLKQEQADEVKKHDYCNTELHSNEVATTKTQNLKAELDAKVEDLKSTTSRLSDEVTQAQASIAELHTGLQRASENRQNENRDFQTTISDQKITQNVLKKALDKLATYYDSQSFVQAHKQTPPVPQKEYKPHAGAEGVMQLLEKLIHEAQGLEKEAVKGEGDAQAQYETLVADTNASVEKLQVEVATKTENRAEAQQKQTETEGEAMDAAGELENLAKLDADLHKECDYLTKNFDVRQQGRAQEIEALQQAKQILSGADLS